MASCKLLPIVYLLLLTDYSNLIHAAQPRAERSRIPDFISFLSDGKLSDSRDTISAESSAPSREEILVRNVENSLKSEINNSPFTTSIEMAELDDIIDAGVWVKVIVLQLNRTKYFKAKFSLYKPLVEDHFISSVLFKSYKKIQNKISEHAKLPRDLAFLIKDSEWSFRNVYRTGHDIRATEEAFLESYVLGSLEQLIDSIRNDKENNFKMYLLLKSIVEFHPEGLDSINFPFLKEIFPFLFKPQNTDWFNTLIEWANTIEHEASMAEMVEQLYKNIANLLNSKQKSEIQDLFFFTKLNQNLKYFAVHESLKGEILQRYKDVAPRKHEIEPAEFISALLELEERRLDEVLSKIYEMKPVSEMEEAIKIHLTEMCTGLIDFSRSLDKPECTPRYMCLLRHEHPARKHTARLLTTAYSLSEALNKKDMRDVADILQTFLYIDDCEKAFPGDCPEEYLPQNLSLSDHAEL